MAYTPKNPNGQATMANSQPVTIASDQSAVKVDNSAVTQPVSASSLPLPSGAATAANQTTEISSLSTIATNTGNTATSANQTNGNQQTKVTDGTNIVNVLKSDGTAAGQNAQIVAGTSLVVPFSTTIATAVATTDALNYNSVAVEFSSQGTSSTATFQVSNDNVNWRSISLFTSTNTIASATTTATISSFSGPLPQRYFRISISGISSGTTAGVVVFKSTPTATNGVWAVQSSTWNVGSSTATGSAAPANAFYLGAASPVSGNLVGIQTASSTSNVAGSSNIASVSMAQLDDTSPTSITENNFGNLRISADRSLLVTERSTTPTQTSVAASASSVSLLAANNSRKGATITNDSSAVLYLKLGSTASTTSYTTTLAGNASAPFAYYEVPFGYVGAIDGIWASATGNARITEIT